MLPGAEMLFGGAKVSAKSYVKNGLIGLWDGIENAGFGKHSGNTLVWKNLGSLGSAYDATRLAQAQAWTDNGAEFHNGNINYVFKIPGYFMRDEMGGEWSYELVFSPSGFWVAGATGANPGIFGNHGSGKGIVGGQDDGNNSTVSFNLYYPDVVLWKPVISEYFSQGHIASVSQAASNSSHSATTWKDGVTVSSVGSVDVKLTYYLKGTSIGSAYERKRGEGHRTFDGIIHCVRVYNRPITAAEVAKNHAVDVKRFGGFQ